MPAAKKHERDLPTPSELAETLTACADALLGAYSTLVEEGNTRGAKAIQNVEPALRRAGTTLSEHADAVAQALEQAQHYASPSTKDDD